MNITPFVKSLFGVPFCWKRQQLAKFEHQYHICVQVKRFEQLFYINSTERYSIFVTYINPIVILS